MMYRLTVPLLFTFAVPFYAHAAALAVRNISVDQEKQKITFEVVNVSSKTIHSWIVRISSKNRQPQRNGDAVSVNAQTTSEFCSRVPGSPIPPLELGESRECDAGLRYGRRVIIDPDVSVIAVLFEDGSAEGDVTELDDRARERLSAIRSLEFWIERLDPALAARTPREQLEAMQKSLLAPDSDIPLDFRYDPAVVEDRRSLLASVGFSLEVLDTPKTKDPRAQAMGQVESLKQQLASRRSQPDAFPPRRGVDLATLDPDQLSAWKVSNSTTALHPVAARDSSRRRSTMLFLQNVSKKPITALAVTVVDSEPHRYNQTEDCFLTVTPACALPGSSYALSIPRFSGRTLIINAVVFEDGTGDGTQRDIDSINFDRLGRMFEMERVRGIVDAADADFTTLSAQLGGLPQSPPEAIVALEHIKLPGVTIDRVRSASSFSLFSFFSGVRTTRERILHDLDEASARRGSTAAAWEEIRQEVRDLSDRYRVYCQRVYAPKNNQ